MTTARPTRLAALAALLLCSFPALPQLTTADITGSVRDSQGLLVSGARIEVRNQATGRQHPVQSNDLGAYVARSLPPGSYTLTVEASGFKKHRRDGIVLTGGQVARIDIALEVGAVTESVSVTADVSPVDISTAILGTHVDTRRLENLPLAGRNILRLASLEPGVTRIGVNDGPSSAQQTINVNGHRSSSTSVSLDGASQYYGHRGAALIQPPPDAVQEVKVITSGVSAEFKRGSSAISTVTRSGTNEFHGALWNYFRNDAFNARSFFASAVSKLRYNQFGAAGGGPIVRNKAFFFASFQGFENPTERLVSSAFPPAEAERRGDFNTTIGQRPNDPLNNNQPFPGAIIPQARMDPVAVKILDRIPLPTRPNGQYVAQVGIPNRDRMLMGRVDYDFSPRDRTTIRGFHDHPTSENPFPNSATVNAFGPLLNSDRSQNWNLGHTHTFTPALLMTLRASYTRYYDASEHTNRETLNSFGAKYVMGGGPGAMPELFVSGRFNASGGGEGSPARVGETYETAGDLVWFTGRHEVKFGADLQRLREYFGSTDRSYGIFNFDGTFTRNAFADYLLGTAVTLQQQSAKTLDNRYWAPGFYVQDRWRLHPRFTVNAGIRFDIFGAWRAHWGSAWTWAPGKQSTYIPKAPPNVLYDKDSEFPYRTDYLNPAPRIGFAWDVFGNGKTSLRGGYGISFDPMIAQITCQNAQPFGVDVRITKVGPLSDPQRYFGNPFAAVADLQNPTYVFPASIAGSWYGDIVTPYVQNLSLTLEQQLAAGTLVQTSYVGSLTRHEGSLREANPARYMPGATTTNTDARRLYAPTFSSIRAWATDAIASYHALQVVVSRRLSRGLTYSAAYAWSKAIDEGSRNDAANNWWIQNPNDRRADRGLGDYDVRHRLVASWVWELPLFNTAAHPLARFAGGWQLAGIGTVQSGRPVSIATGSDASLTAAQFDRPNVSGDPRLSTDRPRDQFLARYFDASRFTRNAPGEYGNAGRNFVIGPGLVNFDLSLSKTFALWETRRLEFRCDAFGAFNNPAWGQPGPSMASAANFGRITSASGARNLQLALRLEF